MAPGGRPIKLLFDETLGHPIVSKIAQILAYDKAHDIDALSMHEFGSKAKGDGEWAPAAKAADRMVITADRARANDGAPINLLLPLHRVTAAFFTTTLHGKRSQFEKARAIFDVWPEMAGLMLESTPGTRLRIGIHGTGFSVAEWPIGEADHCKLERFLAQPNIDRGLFPGLQDIERS